MKVFIRFLCLGWITILLNGCLPSYYPGGQLALNAEPLNIDRAGKSNISVEGAISTGAGSNSKDENNSNCEPSCESILVLNDEYNHLLSSRLRYTYSGSFYALGLNGGAYLGRHTTELKGYQGTYGYYGFHPEGMLSLFYRTSHDKNRIGVYLRKGILYEYGDYSDFRAKLDDTSIASGTSRGEKHTFRAGIILSAVTPEGNFGFQVGLGTNIIEALFSYRNDNYGFYISGLRSLGVGYQYFL